MLTIYARVCGLLLSVASMGAYAQWVPVSSNIRFTTEVIKNGNSTRKVKEGVFYRTENGSTLTHWMRGDSDSKRGSGELFDNQTLAQYEIFYEAKQMIERPSGLTEPRKPDYEMDLKPVGTDSVGGIHCDLVEVDFAGKTMKPQQVGYACVARDNGLLLKQETRFKRPDGTVVHTLLEMYDTKLNVDPGNDEFNILHTFTVLKRTNEKPMPSIPD